jgi:hypothetical protein
MYFDSQRSDTAWIQVISAIRRSIIDQWFSRGCSQPCICHHTHVGKFDILSGVVYFEQKPD